MRVGRPTSPAVSLTCSSSRLPSEMGWDRFAPAKSSLGSGANLRKGGTLGARETAHELRPRRGNFQALPLTATVIWVAGRPLTMATSSTSRPPIFTQVGVFVLFAEPFFSLSTYAMGSAPLRHATPLPTCLPSPRHARAGGMPRHVAPRHATPRAGTPRAGWRRAGQAAPGCHNSEATIAPHWGRAERGGGWGRAPRVRCDHVARPCRPCLHSFLLPFSSPPHPPPASRRTAFTPRRQPAPGGAGPPAPSVSARGRDPGPSIKCAAEPRSLSLGGGSARGSRGRPYAPHGCMLASSLPTLRALWASALGWRCAARQDVTKWRGPAHATTACLSRGSQPRLQPAALA